MATFKFEGVDELISQYEKLYDNSEEMIGKAIYNGAAVVMKEVVGAIESLSTDNRFGTSDNPASGPNEYQKAGLRQSVGIAPMRNDGGFRNVKIGFDGYNGLHTKTWPQGQPNAMVARAVESGTSFMRKQPFMRKAEQTAKGKCEQAMAQTIDKEIAATMKGSGGTGGTGSSFGSGGSGGSGKSRSITPKRHSSTKGKTTAKRKSTGTLKTIKKSVAKYKQVQRKISDPLKTKGSLKKYGKKIVKNKKRGGKK